MLRRKVVLMATWLSVLPVAGRAQSADTGECGDAAGGSIVGAVVYDGVPESERGLMQVFLTNESGTICRTGSEPGGGFRFTDVPAGSYEVRFAQGGVLRPFPISVEVTRAGVATIEVRAEPEDVVVACARWLPGCESILGIAPPAGLLPEQRIEFRFWQIALAVAGAGNPETEGWIACLRPLPDEAVRTALSAIHADLVPADECGATGVPLGPMRHLGTGRPARMVTMQVSERPNGSFLAFGYSRGGVNSSAYECPIAFVGDELDIGRCVLTIQA